MFSRRFRVVSFWSFLASSLSTSVTAQTPVPLIELGHPVEGTMAPTDISQFRVRLAAGAVARLVVEQHGIDLIITTFGPNGDSLGEFDSPNYRDGPEPVSIVATMAGDYRLELQGWEGEVAPTGSFEIRIDELLTAEEYAAERAALRARRDSAIAWIAHNATRLTTVEPGHGFTDMQPLREAIGSARVVALGEATHGTREFFQFKHRMLEFLVSELGFTAFAIEATMPEAFDVDEYIQTGRGDPAKALAGLYFWTWNTEEVLALIEWMREWNADPRHTRKLHFYGFDMQSPSRAARVVRDYLMDVDREAADENEQWLEMLVDPFQAAGVRSKPAAERESLATRATQLLSLFDRRKDVWASRSDRTRWELARQHARILTQNMSSSLSPDSTFIVRDRAMAENVQWILEREGPQGRVALWAHNGHVANDCRFIDWMGCHLRRVLGDSMVIAGFSFNRGSFQSMALPFSAGLGLQSFTVAPLDETSLDATLAAANLTIATLDLRERPTTGVVAEWFDEPHETRSIGSGYADGLVGFTTELVAPQHFDLLLFVDSTTRARPQPGGRREPVETLPSLANPGFEDLTPDGHPRDWIINTTMPDFDFRITASNDDPSEGHYAGVVSRTGDKHYGEMYGGPWQRIDATEFQSKRVRFRAMVKTNLVNEESRVYLWINAARPDQFIFMSDGQVRRSTETRSTEWVPVTVDVEVPADAVYMTLGLALVGDGSASIDAASLDVIP